MKVLFFGLRRSFICGLRKSLLISKDPTVSTVDLFDETCPPTELILINENTQ